MSTAAIRAALVALLESIGDIGRVHAFERFAVSETDFKSLYLYDNAIRGWRVSRIASRTRMLASGRYLETQTWNVVGLLSLVDADASEVIAGDLADQIIAAERADPTLGGVVLGLPVEGAAGLQLESIEPVMFASVLCHRVTLQVQLQAITSGEAGGLDLLPGAEGRLVGAIVQRLRDADPEGHFATVEGRIAWDGDDVPATFPAAVVVPLRDEAEPDPETVTYRQRVDRSVGVIVIARAGTAGTDASLAAGGLDVLRETVRAALLGWGTGPSGVVDIPLLYGGGAPVASPLGLMAWRDVFVPSIFVET